jgi:hypothetical protein
VQAKGKYFIKNYSDKYFIKKLLQNIPKVLFTSYEKRRRYSS